MAAGVRATHGAVDESAEVRRIKSHALSSSSQRGAFATLSLEREGVGSCVNTHANKGQNFLDSRFTIRGESRLITVNQLTAVYRSCGINLSVIKQRLQPIDYLHQNPLKTLKNT